MKALRSNVASPPDPVFGDPVLAGIALRDDDAAVIALAAELADVTRAPLTLLNAYPLQTLIAIPPPAWAQALRDEASADVEAVAAAQRADGRAVNTLCRPNPSPVRALHEAAEEIRAWALVVGSSHRGSAGRVLPGGVGERLLHAAPCAVAIAPRGYVRPSGELRRIGVAYAGGPGATATLEQATEIARACGASVTTLTVVHGAAASARERPAAEGFDDAVILRGDPAEALATASAGLDLLITGTREFGTVHSLLSGGVTRTLAHTARCPLFVIPPTRS
jgi:nucleotide-binding universal stress UspA family protein